jgi:hypothetical protein
LPTLAALGQWALAIQCRPAAAIANAVFHATGQSILPIRVDKLNARNAIGTPSLGGA